MRGLNEASATVTNRHAFTFNPGPRGGDASDAAIEASEMPALQVHRSNQQRDPSRGEAPLSAVQRHNRSTLWNWPDRKRPHRQRRGTPVFAGFELNFSTAMNSSTAGISSTSQKSRQVNTATDVFLMERRVWPRNLAPGEPELIET